MGIFVALSTECNQILFRILTYLQAARRPHSDFPTQKQAQVERRHVNQQPLQDVPMPPQMRPPHSARVVDMRKRSVEELYQPAQELFAPLAPMRRRFPYTAACWPRLPFHFRCPRCRSEM